jgi:2-oxoglutarate ferredoxin oxidoreductase subunit beta
MPEICEQLKLPRENLVFVSGIGCSSRFPYYMKTFGFHTIHGRAPAIATGLQLTRPDLQVWVVSGDGDALSIGTNHLVHCLRRNIDVKILLFNNRIYGLTKGQFSPTSEKGKRTKSSPMGSIEHPINPVSFAIASEATFVARAIATDTAHLRKILLRAALHRGSAFVEILQNCNVFNDGAFDSFAASAVRADRCIYLEHGEPLTFGSKRERVIRMRAGHPEVADTAEVPPERLLRFREDSPSPGIAFMLSHLNEQKFPVALGVFRCVDKELYSQALTQQIELAVQRRGRGDFHEYISSGDTWEVT